MSDEVLIRLAAIERRLDRLETAEAAVRPDRPRWSSSPPPLLMPTGPTAEPPGSVGAVGTVRPSLEQAIGLRWAGWVGAITVVIGAALGIEFAYRQGWFAVVSPAARVGAMVVVAAALIGAGEWVYRRVSAAAAVGPFAAGVAVLFLAAYAGYAFYDLYGRATAFVLMGAATVVGAAVARRGNLVSIAAVAIVGGNLAPALLRAGVPSPVGFLSYLLTLQLVAVGLAFRGGRKWWALRGLSLATTAAWVAVVIGQPTFAGETLVAFVIVYTAVYHAERIASAATAADDDPAGSVAFGLCVTAALTAALLYRSQLNSAATRTAEVLAMAAVATGLAAACGRRTAGLAAVAAGFVVQAGGLVVLAVPVAASGGSVVIGWGVLAVAVAVAGRWSRPAVYAAPAVWLLAAVDLLAWVNGFTQGPSARRPLLTIGDQIVPAYVVTAWALAVGGHVVAGLTRRRANLLERDVMSSAVDVTAAVAVLLASLFGLGVTAATGALVIYAAAAVAAVPIGAGVAVVVAAKWMAVDTLLNRPSTGATWTTAGLGVAIVAILIGVGWWRAKAGRRAARVSAVVVGVWAASVGVDAAFAGQSPLAEQVTLSVLWATSATAMVVAGFVRRWIDLRYAGLALFALTLLKVVAVDLANVGTGWRVLSFLGLGGLLLITSVLYGRLGNVAVKDK